MCWGKSEECEKNPVRDYGGNTKFVQKTAEQDKSNVSNEFVVVNDPEVSFSAAVTGVSGSSAQPNQVCNNRKRIEVCRGMEGASRISSTPRSRIELRLVFSIH